MISFKGSILDIYKHDEDTQYSVLKVRPLPSDNGHDDAITSEKVSVVGIIKSPNKGDIIEIQGNLNNHPKFGEQIKAASIIPSELTKKEFTKDFLKSGIIRSLDENMADIVWDSFRERSLEVIKEKPQLISDLTGLPKSKVDSMQKEVYRKLDLGLDYQFNFLKNLGVSDKGAASVVEMFGAKTIQVSSRDPYSLLAVPGIDFNTADQIALTLNTDTNTNKRISAGINHVYENKLNSGHTAVNKYDLIYDTSLVLDVTDKAVEEVVAQKIDYEHFVEHRGKLTSYGIYKQEIGIVENIKRLMEAPNSTPGAVPDFSDTHLNKEQRQSIIEGLNNNVSILTGGPGTGKSTSLKGIVENFEEAFDGEPQILVLASTGKAARRAGETAEKDSNTIHAALGFTPNGGFKKNEKEPLDVDLVIVDESSMVDVPTFGALLKALPSKSKLLLAGDIHQLASVGYGNVLGDLIDSKAIPTTELIEVYRQPGGSNIKTTAIDIKDGALTDYGNEGDDFRFIATSSDIETHNVIHKIVNEKMSAPDGPEHVQFLSPMHGGLLGVKNLNLEMQNVINPATESTFSATFFGTEYRVGDKIMQLRNNKELDVFNGEVGDINYFDYKDKSVWANFDGKMKTIPFEDFKDIQLSYATTVHKSQGSEYPTVIVPISSEHETMVKRQNIYTAVTRGKKSVLLIGDEETLINGIKDSASINRETSLAHHLSINLGNKNVELEKHSDFELSMDF